MRGMGRNWVRMGWSFREMGEALNRYAQALRMGPPPPKFTDWLEDWTWM